MLKVGNVATPATAFTVAVPPSVPPPGFVPMAMVTGLVAVVTTFPCESSMVTWTAGEIEAPAATLLGWTVIMSFAAPPAFTVNALLVAAVKAPEVAFNV